MGVKLIMHIRASLPPWLSQSLCTCVCVCTCVCTRVCVCARLHVHRAAAVAWDAKSLPLIKHRCMEGETVCHTHFYPQLHACRHAWTNTRVKKMKGRNRLGVRVCVCVCLCVSGNNCFPSLLCSRINILI